MFTPLRSKNLRSSVTALYAAAMLVLGFAHVALAQTTRGAPSVTLADGIELSLCLGSPGDNTVVLMICDACVLTSAPGLGAVATPTVAPPDLVASAGSLIADVVFVTRTVARPQSRGPPIS